MSPLGKLPLVLLLAGSLMPRASAAEAAVTITGGHEIAKNDFGRPVALIAAALDVKPDVFREAFSGVTPARGRAPTGEEARKNKAALLKVLNPHGVSNERLDEVSDYYRYQPQRGELWPTKPAKAHAVVESGKLTKIVIDDPGAGYCSPPKVQVEGFRDVKLKVNLKLGKDLKTNGGIASIEVE